MWWINTGDVNGDGYPDVVASNMTEDAVSILLNQGDGTFGAPTAYAVDDYVQDVALADLDQDGDLDLAVAGADEDAEDGRGCLSIFYSKGDGTFSPREVYTASSALDELVVADLDGDGWTDIAAATTFRYASVFLNNGDGTLQAGVNYAAGSAAWALSAGDLNGDSRPDLVCSNFVSMWVLQNAGAP